MRLPATVRGFEPDQLSVGRGENPVELLADGRLPPHLGDLAVSQRQALLDSTEPGLQLVRAMTEMGGALAGFANHLHGHDRAADRDGGRHPGDRAPETGTPQSRTTQLGGRA